MRTQKTLLLLGGSAQQVIAIEKAKARGYRTVLCDYLPDNPGQFAADRFYQVSTTDLAAVLQVAQAERIDGVLAYASDPAAPTAAYVAEQLGLPGNPYAAVKTLCNKDLFRAFLRENGFYTPAAVRCGSEAEVVAAVQTLGLPVIVKPVDSSGSKGVTVLREAAGAADAAAHAFAFTRCGRVIVEEFVEKRHPYLIGGDIFVYEGRVIQWGLMNCHRDSRVNPLVPVGKSFPLQLTAADEAAVRDVLSRLVTALGIRMGAMNVELVVDGRGRVCPIDIGPRSGGNMIPDLLGDIFGTDVVELSVRLAMGEAIDATPGQPGGFYATCNLHSHRAGHFAGIDIAPELAQYLYRRCIYKQPGDAVEFFDNAAKCLGILFFRFPDAVAMQAALAHIGPNIAIRLQEDTPEALRAAFWEGDRQRGRPIGSQYDEIWHVLRENDMAWVQARLREIKAHAIAQTDFYRGYAPEDRFPVVDKLHLTAERAAHTARGGFDGPLHTSSTSGSTGTPFSVVQDARKRSRNIADLKVFGERADYPSHERMVFFRVLSEKLHRTPEQENRENIYYIDSSDLGPAHLEEMKQALIEKQPRIVFSYPSTLVELAHHIRRTGGPAEGFGLRSVLIAGEGISEENRQLLMQVFGCPVYRRYSDMELGILAQDRGDGGPLDLNWGSYYFECLDLNDDVPAPDGEVGRIVITDLYNRAFPMIRYDTGDLGIFETPENGLPRLREIYGRVRDCVYATDGRMVSPAKISVMMWGAAGIEQWQFVQEGRCDYVLRLNCSRDVDTQALCERFRQVLGTDATIRAELVDGIPVTASNKRRAVICNWDREGV